MPEESKSSHESKESDQSPIAEVCESLTDFLLDDILPADIYLGDEHDGDRDLDEEEKGEEQPASMLFFKDVKMFCKSCLPNYVSFLKTEACISTDYPSEAKSDHEEYRNIVESHLSTCLEQHGYGLREFVQALSEQIDDDGQSKSVAEELLEVIECVEKFSSFAEGMMKRAGDFILYENGEDDAFSYGRR
ncbi:hypothetical protein TrVE_jg12346 [Triparma verrucosa]|uniref:BART domain-containing protein n=1 Tax=Triparma verrucosa TaxID=1606542 RepID=A0A9W7B8H7_9STRA|nr:hypothetical protein TrVE_jg12346 [Triparma verrucosa]